MKRPSETIQERAASPGPPASRRHRGWYSHGYVPHFDQPGLVQSVTFRLHDSLPLTVVLEWKRELAWTRGLAATDRRVRELRRRVDRYEDSGFGSCWLGHEGIAALVQDALLHFDDERYQLLAWCIMPNHVHVLVELLEGWPLGVVVHTWKSFTAKEANRLLGRRGNFWADDYHDRYIRNLEHLAAAVRYIEYNPVRAGLIGKPEEWRFSSACVRARLDAGGTLARLMPEGQGTGARNFRFGAGGTPAVPGGAGEDDLGAARGSSNACPANPGLP
jgi:REP element-mobilizing transposase RayT